MLTEDSDGEGGVTLTWRGARSRAWRGPASNSTEPAFPSVISGVHFEADGTADIKLWTASRTRIEAVFAQIELIKIRPALNTTVENALVERMPDRPGRRA